MAQSQDELTVRIDSDDYGYVPRTSTVEEILQMKADLEAGRIKATPWKEVFQSLKTKGRKCTPKKK